ncbi:HSP70 and/or MreB Mbl domain containing protein, partial [Asbolus verrucosus]
KMTDSSLCIGIDLGTTNSCVSYYRNGNVEILENKEGGRTTPSYVLFSDKNPVIVGKYAKKMADMKPEHEIKRLMGREFDDPNIQNNFKYLPFQVENLNDKPLVVVETGSKIHKNTPTQLSTYILKKIKKDVEEKLGENVNKAVITVPAYFSVTQREATLEAAVNAGFTVLKLLNEPTSAALYYYFKNKKNDDDEGYSLVYDLGGGTFDVAILKRTKNDIDIISVDGDSHLGGNDFDNLIAEYVCKILSETHECDQKFNRRLKRRLKNKCEEAKESLSTAEEIEICLEAMFHKGDEPVDIPLTRKQFEQMASDLFKWTIEIVDKCLENSKLSKNDIKEIILSGGSTRIPKIQEMISQFFGGKKLNKFNNPDECVAQGAAIQAALLSTHPEQFIDQIKITDVVPLSLGIEVLGDFMDFVIRRNTPIPISQCKIYNNPYHAGTSLSFKIFEGERADVKKNYFLGNLEIDNLTPTPPRQCKVIVTMIIDQNGILTVKAKEQLSNNTKDLKVIYSRGHRSDREINSAISDARENEAEDAKFLQFAKGKQVFLDYCYSVLFNLNQKQLTKKYKSVYERCEEIISTVKKNGNVEILENKEGGRTTPSFLFFSGKNPIIVGKYAKKMADMKPEHGVYEIKRLMGRDFYDPNVQNNLKYLPYELKNIGGKPLVVVKTKEQVIENTPVQLSAYILKKIKSDAEDKLGETITKAVITVPAYFNVSQREATLEAASKAGFTVLKLLNESTASALYYCYRNKTREESYSLVYDLGGGTFDVAILKRSKENIDIIGVDGDSHLGGNDFDNLIVDYVCKVLSDVYKCNKNFNRRMARRLKNKCEDAKKILSSAEETEIALEALFHHEGDVIEIPLTRIQFEKMADHLFKRTIEIVDRCLANTSLSKSDITEIILSGGSTRIPKIQEMITYYFNGKKLNKFINPDECVAQGAALQAALLSKHSEQSICQIKITDVVPLSLGIEVLGGFMDFIIKKNTSIPTNRVSSFFNVAHAQTSVLFKIYEGERTDVKKNYFLGSLLINNLTPAPPGKCEIIITMTIDQNGILIVNAKEKLNDNTKDLKVVYTRGHRSDKEINFALSDARQHVLEDEEFLKFAKKKKNLMDYCYRALYNLEEQHLRKNHKTIYTRCEQILNLVESFSFENKEKIDILSQEITSLCAPLQKLYQKVYWTQLSRS